MAKQEKLNPTEPSEPILEEESPGRKEEEKERDLINEINQEFIGGVEGGIEKDEPPERKEYILELSQMFFDISWKQEKDYFDKLEPSARQKEMDKMIEEFEYIINYSLKEHFQREPSYIDYITRHERIEYENVIRRETRKEAFPTYVSIGDEKLNYLPPRLRWQERAAILRTIIDGTIFRDGSPYTPASITRFIRRLEKATKKAEMETYMPLINKAYACAYAEKDVKFETIFAPKDGYKTGIHFYPKDDYRESLAQYLEKNYGGYVIGINKPFTPKQWLKNQKKYSPEIEISQKKWDENVDKATESIKTYTERQIETLTGKTKDIEQVLEDLKNQKLEINNSVDRLQEEINRRHEQEQEMNSKLESLNTRQEELKMELEEKILGRRKLKRELEEAESDKSVHLNTLQKLREETKYKETEEKTIMNFSKKEIEQINRETNYQKQKIEEIQKEIELYQDFLK